jgi:hypothetical protein
MSDSNAEYKETNGLKYDDINHVCRDGLGYSFYGGLVKHISRSVENGKPKITLSGVESGSLHHAAVMLSIEMRVPVQFEDYGSFSLATGDLVKVVDLLTDKGHTVFHELNGDTFTPYIPDAAEKFIREQESAGLLAERVGNIADYMAQFPNDHFHAVQAAVKNPVDSVVKLAKKVKVNKDVIATQLLGATEDTKGFAANVAPRNTELAEAFSLVLERTERHRANYRPGFNLRLVDENKDALNILRDRNEVALLSRAMGGAEQRVG